MKNKILIERMGKFPTTDHKEDQAPITFKKTTNTRGQEVNIKQLPVEDNEFFDRDAYDDTDARDANDAMIADRKTTAAPVPPAQEDDSKAPGRIIGILRKYGIPEINGNTIMVNGRGNIELNDVQKAITDKLGKTFNIRMQTSNGLLIALFAKGTRLVFIATVRARTFKDKQKEATSLLMPDEKSVVPSKVVSALRKYGMPEVKGNFIMMNAKSGVDLNEVMKRLATTLGNTLSIKPYVGNGQAFALLMKGKRLRGVVAIRSRTLSKDEEPVEESSIVTAAKSNGQLATEQRNRMERAKGLFSKAQKLVKSAKTPAQKEAAKDRLLRAKTHLKKVSTKYK